MESIEVPRYHCERCGHTWIARSRLRPIVCPRKGCRSAYWDRPRAKPEFKQEERGRWNTLEQSPVVESGAPPWQESFLAEVNRRVQELMAEEPEIDSGVARKQVSDLVKKERALAASKELAADTAETKPKSGKVGILDIPGVKLGKDVFK